MASQKLAIAIIGKNRLALPIAGCIIIEVHGIGTTSNQPTPFVLISSRGPFVPFKNP
jgi:hypothetical protein